MPTVIWLAPLILTLVLITLFVCSYRSYRRERRTTLPHLLKASYVVDTANGPIEYATRGTGPAVLVSHGIMGGYDQGLVLSQILGPGFMCIAPSRFGYLRSSHPTDASPAAQADVFAALLDALGIQRTAILGGSAGGPSALQFALRHPDRCAALVLASSTTQAFQKADPRSLALSNIILHSEYVFWLIMKVLPDVMLTYCGITPAIRARITPAEMEWVWKLISASQPTGPRREGVINDIRQVFALQPVSLEDIRVPTLVTHARDDPLVPVKHGEDAARRIPGARLILMETGGHFCVGNPRTFEQLADFLRSELGNTEASAS